MLRALDLIKALYRRELLSEFSNLCQYDNIDFTILIQYGNLPSSDITAKFEFFLCTPNMNLQNFKCNLSGSEKLYTSSIEIP
jgi:hypothetical protein